MYVSSLALFLTAWAATSPMTIHGFVPSATHKNMRSRGPALFYSNDESSNNNNNNKEEDHNGSSNRSSPSPKRQFKDTDRARFERDLEEAMGNDWRAFRAKLLAQEKYYCIEHKDPTNRTPSSNGFFRRAPATSLLAGDMIGKQPGRNNNYNRPYRNNHHSNSNNNNMEILYNDDPFVSEAELPLLIPKTTIDKHRWAHEIPRIEPGSVLIANERLGGIFHQTVVLIIQHHETEGSYGIVINRPQEGGMGKTVLDRDSNIDLSLKMAFQHSQVTYGGPINPHDFHALHNFGAVTGARKVCPGVYIGGSDELMTQVRCGNMDPRKALFVKGHAAWEGGQLQNEIHQGVWYNAAVSADLILRYAGTPLTPEDNANDLWSDILTCMGGKHEDVARRYGGTGDSRRAMP